MELQTDETHQISWRKLEQAHPYHQKTPREMPAGSTRPPAVTGLELHEPPPKNHP